MYPERRLARCSSGGEVVSQKSCSTQRPKNPPQNPPKTAEQAKQLAVWAFCLAGSAAGLAAGQVPKNHCKKGLADKQAPAELGCLSTPSVDFGPMRGPAGEELFALGCNLGKACLGGRINSGRRDGLRAQFEERAQHTKPCIARRIGLRWKPRRR